MTEYCMIHNSIHKIHDFRSCNIRLRTIQITLAEKDIRLIYKSTYIYIVLTDKL